MSGNHLIFADLEDELCDYARAAALVLPLPFERTTSYGTGTAAGPEALLKASHYLEHYDELTGLPNRVLFKSHLTGAIETARRHGRTLAVMTLDLDQFRRFNETLGHDVGDEILKIVAFIRSWQP